MIARRKTRQVNVGGVLIGGGAAISIQSMTKSPTSDTAAVIEEVRRLESAGCEIVRVAVKDPGDASAIRLIKRKIKIPLVADIHFNHRLALESIKAGADKIRLNPGNIARREDVRSVIDAAKRAGIPIRIGVNSGSALTGKGGATVSDDLVKAALGFIKIFKESGFHDIIISLKASDVVETIRSYRKISDLCDYPLHLGVTASGPYESGSVKSAIGIGSLLADGIGDTIRVSLTADSVEEVLAGKRILEALKLRRFGHEIISCPTCGRCQVDLDSIVRRLERELAQGTRPACGKKPLTIAVMGCEVNGPGEAREADVGIAFGRDSGMLFKKGKAFKKVAAKNAVAELMKLLITYY
jgi:(E)-4-hydroxy-3-methylbut-2-enyl-diphosphate synthase